MSPPQLKVSEARPTPNGSTVLLGFSYGYDNQPNHIYSAFGSNSNTFAS